MRSYTKHLQRSMQKHELEKVNDTNYINKMRNVRSKNVYNL